MSCLQNGRCPYTGYGLWPNTTYGLKLFSFHVPGFYAAHSLNRCVYSSDYAMLDNAVLEAAKPWHFVPAIQSGNAVDKWFIIPVQFSLKDNA